MSPTAFVRSGSTWVQSGKFGKARLNSTDYYFAPPGGGPTYEAVTLGSPTLTDLVDGAQAYNMGMEFSLVAGKDAYGVQWRVPDTVETPPGGAHAVAIWNDDTDVRLAYKEFIPTPGLLQDVLFDVPVALPNGVNYLATVYTIHYVFKAGAPSGLTSPSGNIVAGTGRLASYNGGASTAPKPDASFSSTYHVSPLMGV